MAKIRLCSDDMGNLIEEMKHFSDALENVGVCGEAVITFSPSGDISGTFNLCEGTMLNIDVQNDGDRVTQEYEYV